MQMRRLKEFGRHAADLTLQLSVGYVFSSLVEIEEARPLLSRESLSHRILGVSAKDLLCKALVAWFPESYCLDDGITLIVLDMDNLRADVVTSRRRRGSNQCSAFLLRDGQDSLEDCFFIHKCKLIANDDVGVVASCRLRMRGKEI